MPSTPAYGSPNIWRVLFFGVAVNASKIFASAAPSEVYGEKGTLRMNAITDIEGVRFWEAGAKEGRELGGAKRELNMSEEAEVYARIIAEKDTAFAEKLEGISKDTLAVTQALRRENNIVFGVEN